MKLTWQAAPGNVAQYRIAFKPAAGGERKEISVKGDTTQALLKNLQPFTEYELFVSARYSSGVGEPLLGTGTTLEGKKDSEPLQAFAIYCRYICSQCVKHLLSVNTNVFFSFFSSMKKLNACISREVCFIHIW